MKPCKITTRYKSEFGYGRLSKVTYGEDYEHRWVYKQAHGEIPKGMVVRHTCDNPSCIEITHLVLGTHADNHQDAIDRNRAKPFPVYHGEEHPTSLLSEDEVRAIRNNKSLTQKELAGIYQVDRRTIGDIIARKSWKHLDEK